MPAYRKIPKQSSENRTREGESTRKDLPWFGQCDLHPQAVREIFYSTEKEVTAVNLVTMNRNPLNLEHTLFFWYNLQRITKTGRGPYLPFFLLIFQPQKIPGRVIVRATH